MGPLAKRTIGPVEGVATVFDDEDWLATRHALSISPSVINFKVSRESRKVQSAAPRVPYIGFGNPLLDGPDPSFAEARKRSAERQNCKSKGLIAQMPNDSQARASRMDILVSVDSVRRLTPLPETADEICAVAAALNAQVDDVYLGRRASKSTLMALDAQGRLARAKVLHFATHGSMRNELLDGLEPGLVLSPGNARVTQDDGYLSASDVAKLRLDADLVILSACNTSAGQYPKGEALSGLAKAFFVAGARSLLVSHWYVNSDATVRLIQGMFRPGAKASDTTYADRLRSSIQMMIKEGPQYQKHPEFWAPFVVVNDAN